jgi:hypothetical protein
MAFVDRAKSMMEVLDCASLLGDRLKVAEKARRLVISSGIAPFDFGFDLAPDAFSPPSYRQ